MFSFNQSTQWTLAGSGLFGYYEKRVGVWVTGNVGADGTPSRKGSSEIHIIFIFSNLLIHIPPFTPFVFLTFILYDSP